MVFYTRNLEIQFYDEIIIIMYNLIITTIQFNHSHIHRQ